MCDCCLVYLDVLYMGVGGIYDVFIGYVKCVLKIW